MVKDKDQHTTLPHVSQTPAAPVTTTTTTPTAPQTHHAPVTSGGTSTAVFVTSTQVLLPNKVMTLSVLAGAVSGGAILLIMIVSTLVVILIMKRKRTKKKAGHSVSSSTGLSNIMHCVLCIVVHSDL